MTSDQIKAALLASGIPVEEEQAVPSNGVKKPLPYMVIRSDRIVDGDDAGRIRIHRINWTVALFTKEKEPGLDAKILRALASVGQVSVNPFPDGTPYQTNFEFKTTEIIKGGN